MQTPCENVYLFGYRLIMDMDGNGPDLFWHTAFPHRSQLFQWNLCSSHICFPHLNLDIPLCTVVFPGAKTQADLPAEPIIFEMITSFCRDCWLFWFGARTQIVANNGLKLFSLSWWEIAQDKLFGIYWIIPVEFNRCFGHSWCWWRCSAGRHRAQLLCLQRIWPVASAIGTEQYHMVRSRQTI